LDSNAYNIQLWGVVVGGKGKVNKGGVREAVRRWLVTEEHCWNWWGLEKMENGDVFDEVGYYGEKNVMYRRWVNGVAVPVTEGLFVEWEEEEDFDEEDN